MADAALPQDQARKRRPAKALLLSAGLALVMAAAGFLATFSGAIPGLGGSGGGEGAPAPLPDIAFVPIDPVVITLGSGAEDKVLRLTAQLEVNAPYRADVALLLPRILDVLNGYLRAVEVTQLEDRAALVRLRAQMLRRIQMVTGDGRVRDLLITEFVLK